MTTTPDLEAFYDRHRLVPISATDKVDSQDITVIPEHDARRALEAADQRVKELTLELAQQLREAARIVNVAAGIDVKQWREDQARLISSREEMYESRQAERATVRRQTARIAELEAQHTGMPTPAELSLQEIALMADRHRERAAKRVLPTPNWVAELYRLLGDHVLQPGNAPDGSYDGSEGEHDEDKTTWPKEN